MLPVDKKLIQRGLYAANFSLLENSTWYTTTPTTRTISLPFYLIEWGHFYAAKDYSTVRKNDRFLLFHTLSGTGSLSYGNKHYLLRENTITIIWCGIQHEYHTEGSDIWNFRWIHFNGSCAHEYFKVLGDSQPVMIHIPEDDKCVDLVKSIADTNLPNSLTQNLLNTLTLTELMTRLCCTRQSALNGLSRRPREIIDDSISYMEDHLHTALTIEEVATSVFLSKYYFIRLFHKAIGMSPYQYLIHLRINKAKELLLLTNQSLAQIAEQTGFCDSKNLINMFKKVTGQTPGQFRQSICR